MPTRADGHRDVSDDATESAAPIPPRRSGARRAMRGALAAAGLVAFAVACGHRSEQVGASDDALCANPGGGCPGARAAPDPAVQQAQVQATADFAKALVDNTGWPLPLDLAAIQAAARSTIVEGDGSDAVYYRALWGVLQSVPEGHQVLDNDTCDTPEMFAQGASRFGVCGRPHGDDVIVTSAHADNPLGLAPGDRITAAGGDRGPGLLEAAALRPVCGAYAPSESGRRTFAAASFFGTVPVGMELTVEPAGGGPVRTIKVPSQALPPENCLDPLGRNRAFNAQASVRPDGVAVIRLPRLFPIDAVLPDNPTDADFQKLSDAFEASVESAFASVKDAPAIVWDTRGNGGGLTEIAMKIVSGMPGARASDLSSCVSRVPGSQPPAFSATPYAAYSVAPGGPFSYTGKVAVIVEGLNYSAADYFAYAVAHTTNVPLVGATTAGAYGGEGPVFDIPGTPKAHAAFDLNHCVDAKGMTLEGHGTAPTVPVDYDPADLHAGIDTVLEAAVKLVAPAHPPTPDAGAPPVDAGADAAVPGPDASAGGADAAAGSRLPSGSTAPDVEPRPTFEGAQPPGTYTEPPGTSTQPPGAGRGPSAPLPHGAKVGDACSAAPTPGGRASDGGVLAVGLLACALGARRVRRRVRVRTGG